MSAMATLPYPPFYWGLNGVMSVIGLVGTVIVAVLFGFEIAMLPAAPATCLLHSRLAR
jgi:hypothetical protein